MGKNLVVAVSGGVDSVVMLDILYKLNKYNLIVAHVNHGIRDEESNADSRFVKGLARKYGLPFENKDLDLYKNASEETARNFRYDFLRYLSRKYKAKIAVAHHVEDFVESVGINLIRGTGWRGLAVMDSEDIVRPLKKYTKDEIYKYSLENNLEWCQDETNFTDIYLRNRIRKKVKQLDTNNINKIYNLIKKQHKIKRYINNELEKFELKSRYFYTMLDQKSADEILRYYLEKNNISQTRPQRARILQAIKTSKTNTKYQVSKNIYIHFSKKSLKIEKSA